MTYLSEDPTYLAGGLLLLAGAFVIALKATQQGKYLLGAGSRSGSGLCRSFLIEWMWVTDNERIEKVVHEVRTAVLKSDADGVLAHLAPNVMYSEVGYIAHVRCHPRLHPYERERCAPRIRSASPN